MVRIIRFSLKNHNLIDLISNRTETEVNEVETVTHGVTALP